MDRFSKNVLKTIRENDLMPEGSRVILGLSGGADSVCLASTLLEMQKLLRIRLEAVHVNHNLRGEESLRDQVFCEAFCRERDLPFAAVSVDVKGLVSDRGLSTEEAARILRYRALAERAGGDGLIAVAHHADDQAETILLNLLRGTGLKGMRGMEYRRDNIVRPLLDRTRREILEALEARGLSFVTDSTNLSDDYARNRLRSKVLPELERINTGAARHLLEAGKKAGAAEEFLEETARKRGEELASFDGASGTVHVLRKKLREDPQILRRYVIIELLRRAGIPLKDWEEEHIAAIDRLLGGVRGQHRDLPGGVKADNTEQETVISKV